MPEGLIGRWWKLQTVYEPPTNDWVGEVDGRHFHTPPAPVDEGNLLPWLKIYFVPSSTRHLLTPKSVGYPKVWRWC